MAELTVEETQNIFRQAGVDIGGRHLFAVSIATNGPVSHITALDVNDDVWLWKDSEPLTWMKLPRVPFLEKAAPARKPADWVKPHQYFKGTFDDGEFCKLCRAAEADPIHSAAQSGMVKQ